VTNAGGLGVIGGVGYTPEFLQQQIDELKKHLKDPKGKFGIDLLLPQVGGSARKTNYDYTGGKLPELIDICIKSGCALFVSAVGVPPKWAVDKLHAAGIPVMNMVGHVKHVAKALESGVDIICAQGGEGGGHTGDIATSILIPKVVDECRGKKSPLTGKNVNVVAAGGIFDGRGLAMAMALGAEAVWVGTRFICATEAGAPPRHQKAVIACGYDDTLRTIIFTGRPLRVQKNPYILDWELNKQAQIKELTGKGILPVYADMAALEKSGKEVSFQTRMDMTPLLMGQCAAAVNDIKPAAQIMNEMMVQAIEIMRGNTARISKL
jgi:NAD(P)H-dependent flavin oxidoreductase YrpB (nitropropane dioxygenase family)